MPSMVWLSRWASHPIRDVSVTIVTLGVNVMKELPHAFVPVFSTGKRSYDLGRNCHHGVFVVSVC